MPGASVVKVLTISHSVLGAIVLLIWLAWQLDLHAFSSSWLRTNVVPLAWPQIRDIQLSTEAIASIDDSRPTVRQYDWWIRRSTLSPDGVLREMITVNGAFPGPTIEANVGDTLIVTVHNRLTSRIAQPERQRYNTMIHEVHHPHADQEVAIHWHGMSMRRQNDQDGAHGFTSCTMAPNEDRTYNFTLTADDVGTMWWHSHSGMSRSDGLWGALIVREQRERDTVAKRARQAYEYEQLVAVGDHYHTPGSHQLSWFMSTASMGFEPTPESSLINGKSVFDCRRAVAPDTRCSPLVGRRASMKLHEDGKTRLRIINVGAVANQLVSIDEHILTVIEADGVLVKPVQVKRLPVGPGQRYSVIAERTVPLNTKPSYWLRATMDRGCFNMPNPALNHTTVAQVEYMQASGHPDVGHRIGDLDLRSRGISFTSPNSHAWPDEDESETGFVKHACHDFNHTFLQPLIERPAPSLDLTKGDRKIILTARMPRLSKHKLSPMGYMNGSSWRAPEHPLLEHYSSAAHQQPPTSKGQLVVEVPPGHDGRPATVEVVVQNMDDGPHPFHLHGHKFWVMETFEAKYLQGPYRDRGQSNEYKLADRAVRDTFNIPRRGYAVLRWKADNPGVWAFHCHVLVHMASGMAMAFVDMPDELRALNLTTGQCARESIQSG